MQEKLYFEFNYSTYQFKDTLYMYCYLISSLVLKILML